MKSSDYSTTLSVTKTPKEAFNAINNVTGWWTENLEGHSQKLNDEFTVRFGTTWKTFKIIEFVPEKKVVWQVMDCYLPWNKNKTEWTGTKVSFEIGEKDNKTQIRFTHIGLVPEFDCYDACSNAWTDYVRNSLMNLITVGKGKPEPLVVSSE